MERQMGWGGGEGRNGGGDSAATLDPTSTSPCRNPGFPRGERLSGLFGTRPFWGGWGWDLAGGAGPDGLDLQSHVQHRMFTHTHAALTRAHRPVQLHLALSVPRCHGFSVPVLIALGRPAPADLFPFLSQFWGGVELSRDHSSGQGRRSRP